MGETHDILVSGWRFISHSFAVVAQFHCLDLLRRAPGVRLYFEDLPYHDQSWRAMAGLFDAEAGAALRSIPPLPKGRRPHTEFRISFPYDLFRPSRASRMGVFGTSEMLDVSPDYVAEGIPIAEAQRRSGATLLTPSNWSRQGIVRSGVPEACVAVVPHGFDPAVFRPAVPELREQIRRDFGIGPEDMVFLHVGAMTSNKGLRYLLPAFARVLQDRPRARLILKGADGLYQSKMHLESQLAELESDVAQAVLGRMVYMGGAFSFTDMARLYQASDCYVSSYVAEGFNMPVLEAAACGVPVICTAGGPTDDFVSDEFAFKIRSSLESLGIPDQPAAMGLIPDVPHLVQLMLRVIDDAGRREATRDIGPAWLAERFTWSKVTDRLLQVLLPR